MSSSNNNQEMTTIDHLIELRSRLIKIILAIGVVFLILVPFSSDVYVIFARPVLDSLIKGQSMLAKDAIDVLVTPLKVSFFIAFLLSMPWTIYQMWAFVAPAMYLNEKRIALPILITATCLFYLGILFAYFVILPILFRFLGGINLDGVAFMPDITNYVSLSLTMFFAFGLVFEVPVATVILVMFGVIETKTLTKKRPYIILLAFIIGMVLTPPDVISQTLLAVPLLILFEIGLFISKKIEKNRKKH